LRKKLSIAKFGGSLLDAEGNGISKILKRIHELKKQGEMGPIAVFSAPTGCTDELIKIGESYAQSTPTSTSSVFSVYRQIVKLHVKSKYADRALAELENYEARCGKHYLW